jgi:8-oxo-dGTP pyrophosphatase MutT (NUDIX family)
LYSQKSLNIILNTQLCGENAWFLQQILEIMKTFRQGIFIVVYRKDKDKILYLLLKRKLHWKGWEFPKGGIENGEDLLKAAKRECREESGLRPVFIERLPYHGKYPYHSKLKDRPGFSGQTWKLFAVKVKESKVKIDKKEHSGFKWVDYKTAENFQ